jgi:hypothetical protein
MCFSSPQEEKKQQQLQFFERLIMSWYKQANRLSLLSAFFLNDGDSGAGGYWVTCAIQGFY